MSEINKSQAAAGVINFGEVVVTQDKKFKPREEFNNLCQAHLVSVEIKETETPKVDENGVASTYEYAGIPVPTIVFRYKEEPVPDDEVDRFYTDSFRIVTTRKTDGTAVDVKTFTSLITEAYRNCRHRLDAYIGCPNFVEPGFPQPIDMNADINGRIAQWKAFCEFFVKAFNVGKEGKPVFLDEKGEPIVVWMKLLAHYGDRKYLCTPGFVGQGYVERVINGKKPSIEILPSETVELSKDADKDEKPAGAAAEAGVAMDYGSGQGVNADAINALKNRYAGNGGTPGKY